MVDTAHEKVVAQRALLKLTAIERYVNLAIIAQGILSYLAIAQSQWVWDIHYASSWLRSYSSGLPSDETVQRALQSHFMTTFSLKMVKDWMSSNQLKKLPEPSPKVREHHTLGQFLSS